VKDKESVGVSIFSLHSAMLVRLIRSRASHSGFGSPILLHRSLQTGSASSQLPPQELPTIETDEPLTHFKITLRRSAIGLTKNKKATLESLGIFRRMQTVFHPHRPEFAGKILEVKELVEVQNVPASAVRSKAEMTRERRPNKGYMLVSRSEES